jgi:MFS family permease
MGNTSSSPKFKDVIVAVHGIGQQSRYSTVRSVATRLAASPTLLAGSLDRGRPAAPQPLGYFHSEPTNITSVKLVDDAAYLGNTALATTGFAEVFWADIPENAVKEGSTLEETKAWVRTVVARARVLWEGSQISEGVTGDSAQGKEPSTQVLVPPDFGLAAEVLDEMLETVQVLENLLFLADKAGLFKFDLAQVLEDYLGDVQIVTEFSDYRTDVVARFHQAMADIYEEQRINGNDEVRLHIVAHSEGTVVSFLGLLLAMSGKHLAKPAPPDDPLLKDTPQIPEWLKHVHGYMTIGSPIDKHLLLWPELWKKLNPSLADAVLPAGQIHWRNYYDYGDPVGFNLDTARAWLKQQKTKAFEFEPIHDMGFARYLLPGKAHTDYWNDPDVFEHFVDDVIRIPKPGDPPAKRPANKRAIAFLSPALPYVFSAVLLIIGVYLLCKAVSNFTAPDDPLTKYFLITQIGVEPTPGISRWELFRNTLGISGLIAGTTLFTRFPRLASGRCWKVAGAFAFAIGCVAYSLAVIEPSRDQIGAIFSGLGPCGPTVGVLLLALLVGFLVRWVMRHGTQKNEDRRQRWILKGMRPLILFGAFAVAVIVAPQLYPEDFGLAAKLTTDEVQKLMDTKGRSADQINIINAAGFDRKELDQLVKAKPERLDRLARVKPFLTTPPPVWPVLLASAGFLYLWWLATLVFDLAFVWQRYVRRSVANQRLKEWGHKGKSSDGPDQTEAGGDPDRPASEI